MKKDTLDFHFEIKSNGLFFENHKWKNLSFKNLSPKITLDGKQLKSDIIQIKEKRKNKKSIYFSFQNQFAIYMDIMVLKNGLIKFKSKAKNISKKSVVLNDVSLLETSTPIYFEENSEHIKIMQEKSGYDAQVLSLAEFKNNQKIIKSSLFWVIYNSILKEGFLVGFITSERFLGNIKMEIDKNHMIKKWLLGFDGGDLFIEPEEELKFEEFIFLKGKDPWQLLEIYGKEVKKRHKPYIPKRIPVSFCSWYPFRLGVTEEKILKNAEIAKKRLKKLGLNIIEVDLGWEKGYLPSSFTENDQFPHGLMYLSKKLEKMGFKLGIWKAPYTISEFDPLFKKHSEYLISDKKGKPIPYWTWYWQPHGKVFILDLSHPGAQKWLKEKIVSLKKRGIKYFKLDFISCALHPLTKNRYNKKIVSGGGTEFARIGNEIIKKSLPKNTLILNCGGPEMPGKGHFPLIYVCQDTGNTGFVGWEFMKKNYHTLACHLFKNHRWGIIQPSCLCVGLPGTLEEARVRATMAFFAGGQIDISDNLSYLPEERWKILTKTLPPIGITAKVIDLFEPITSNIYEYTITSKKPEEAQNQQIHFPGSVWHIHIKKEWDIWDLIAIFELEEHFKKEENDTESGRIKTPEISRFTIPFEKLGLNPKGKYLGFEFWSEQFLGIIPGKEKNPKGYIHPGDYQTIIASDKPGFLDIAFFGPGVKLISLRKLRRYPWVIGTTFHQSVGGELRNVLWDKKNKILKGELHRPPGEMGYIVFFCPYETEPKAKVNGVSVQIKKGFNNSWALPIITEKYKTLWHVSFK